MSLPGRVEARRLHLEATSEDFAEGIWKAKESSLDELRPWMSWADDDLEGLVNFTRRCRQQWSAGMEWNFTIFEPEDEVIGCTSIFGYVPRYGKAEVGYWIRSDRTGNGFAAEAVSALVAFGFDHLGLHRIELHCGVANDRSIRVAEKLGFEREGTMRHALRATSDWYDAYLYALLATDMKPRLHLKPEGVGD